MNRKVTFTLSELDLRRAGYLHVFSAIRDRRTIIRVSTIWGGGMVVLAGFFHLSGMRWSELRENLPLFALITFAATFGVAFAIPLVLGPIVIRRRFRQDKLLRQAATASWDEDAYEVEQPGIHNRIPWGDYSKWREDRHLFMFFRSDYTYQVLPKRVLTQEQIADIGKVLLRGFRARNDVALPSSGPPARNQ